MLSVTFPWSFIYANSLLLDSFLSKMLPKSALIWQLCVVYFLAMFAIVARAESPYRFFTWNVTYGDIYPLGVRQQVCKNLKVLIIFWMFFIWKIIEQDLHFCFQGILINGQFPGPDIHSVTNDNLIINVHNSLPEPFLISWLALLWSWNFE